MREGSVDVWMGWVSELNKSGSVGAKCWRKWVSGRTIPGEIRSLVNLRVYVLTAQGYYGKN